MEEKVKQLLKIIFGSEEEFEVTIEDESTNSISRTISIDSKIENKPRLIGKGGNTIKSIHNIVNLMRRSSGERYFVKVKD